MAAWYVLDRCRGQVRVGMGGVCALDYAACLSLASALGGPLEMIADLLPIVEPIIVKAWKSGE
jgi:hypothetical protein